jgi:hypothetical protein
MADAPRVSVVVPVRDRRALLRELLDALAAQTFADFEVVVVDDGSTDGTPDEARADADAGRPVRLVVNEGRGAYAGRRTGVAASSAPYLAFTDSDCVPTPEWLAAGVAALDKGADVVNGLTLPTRAARPFERTMSSGEEGLYPTCNVFYRRDAYDAAGGFDGTAADRFGFRQRRRRVAAFAPDAVVHHQVLPRDTRDLLRRTVMMRAFPALFREVPELRGGTLVRHGAVLSGPGRVALYAAGAALVARRPRTAVLALGWWAAARANGLRGEGGSVGERLASLPALLALDLLTIGCLLVGSARYRTVVL